MTNKNNGVWIIIGLLLMAGVLLFLAFSKNAPINQEQESGSSLVNIQATQEVTDQKIEGQKAVAKIVSPLKEVTRPETLAVQVYSFKEKPRAEAALTALKDKGYLNSYILVSEVGQRGTWYRVRVGTYNTEADALQALEKVTKDFKSGIIVSE